VHSSHEFRKQYGDTRDLYITYPAKTDAPEADKSACEQRCPKFQLCEKMIKTGQAHSALSNSHSSTVEYEAEDGSLISSAEFWGTADMTPEQLEMHRQAGENLRDGGKLLQKQLLEGCSGEGPIELSTGYLICRSANSSEVFFTDEDLDS